MLAWRELQAGFGRAVLTGDFSALAPSVREDGMKTAGRIAVYRNNVLTSLTALLAERFPVVEQLVDSGFFAFAAGNFITQSPPDQACLDLYGAQFPKFLGQFPPCAELPYLGDVAGLEWALFEAARAPFVPAIGFETLNIIDGATAMGLRFRPDPAIRYLASNWPVEQIWRAHQRETVEIDLAAGGCRLEIRRIGEDLAIRNLAPAEFAFRNDLAAGAALEHAVSVALQESPGFHLFEALADLFRDQWVTGWIAPTNSGESP